MAEAAVVDMDTMVMVVKMAWVGVVVVKEPMIT